MNHPLPPPAAHHADSGTALDRATWTNGFGRLPARFYTRLQPTPLPAPYLVGYSDSAGALVGLSPQHADDPALVSQLIGNAVPARADPLAAVYAGHQFGVYVPQLGDGRAILLGGISGGDAHPWELQLKGAGKTPYSRMGDGRAVLRSSIREFLCSEAMHGLGIPTTRALSVAGSDTPIFRETTETAAVVVRMAPSFVRFGSFEFFFYRNLHGELKQLADYVIDTFYPQCRAVDSSAGDGTAPYLAFIEEVSRRTARMVAQWQGVGFCHGVMNTDNMSILGLTIDYGPFGFVDGFDANHICNHSDEHGRYAYNMQPGIAHWNLYCLGQALMPLMDDVEATKARLDTFKDEFALAMDELFHAKLGLKTRAPDDEALIETLITVLHENRVDWTVFWRRLAQLRTDGQVEDDAPLRDLFADRTAFDAWAQTYRQRLRREHSVDAERAVRMNAVNPKYVLRNYLAETAIAKARGDDGARDFTEVERLLRCLRRPFDEQPEFEAYAALPPDWAGNLHLSCSS